MTRPLSLTNPVQYLKLKCKISFFVRRKTEIGPRNSTKNMAIPPINITPMKYNVYCALPNNAVFDVEHERTVHGIDPLSIVQSWTDFDPRDCGLPIEDEPTMLNTLIKGQQPVKSVQIRRVGAKCYCKYIPHKYDLKIITKERYVIFKDDGAYLVRREEVRKYLKANKIEYNKIYNAELKIRILLASPGVINNVLSKFQCSIS